MAVTITRTPWIDDDGTGTYGTVINNAEKTALYNQIDAALAQLMPLSGGGTMIGNVSVQGNLAVSGLSTFSPSVAIRNTTPNNHADLYLGNDLSASLFNIATYGSTYAATAGYDQPNGTVIGNGGAGGLAIMASDAAGTIRFYAGGTAERMRIGNDGRVFINTLTNTITQAPVNLVASGSHVVGISIQNQVAGNALYYMGFYNSAGATAGFIQQTGATTVNYGTTSDQRLKDDDGLATDLAALRAVRVHDFRWKVDGRRDRGVFAQEARAVFPRAITEGDDEARRPWGTDYSKFVADLIVGWQQHEAELVGLRAELATLKG